MALSLSSHQECRRSQWSVTVLLTHIEQLMWSTPSACLRLRCWWPWTRSGFQIYTPPMLHAAPRWLKAWQYVTILLCSLHIQRNTNWSSSAPSSKSRKENDAEASSFCCFTIQKIVFLVRVCNHSIVGWALGHIVGFNNKQEQVRKTAEVNNLLW